MSNGKNGRARSGNGRKPARKRPEIRPAVAKSTRVEMENRIQFAMQLICDGCQNWEVIRRCKEQYAGRDGRPISRRSINRYVARARERLLQSVDIGKDEMAAQLAAILHRTISDPAATVRDKQRAVKLLADLFGIRAPLKVAQTDAAGNDIYREAMKDLSLDELRVLAKAHERAEQLRSGSANGMPAGRRNGSA
jgi:hypothetical protein